MSILKLELKNIGPFDHLELDLSDGKGNPHLGPHIIAGTNGSGKSTILRAIARLLNYGRANADGELFEHLCRKDSNASVDFRLEGKDRVNSLEAERTRPKDTLDRIVYVDLLGGVSVPKPTDNAGPGDRRFAPAELLVCGYAPNRTMRHLPSVDLSLKDSDPHANALSFESTVDNARVQAWLLALYSRSAIAKQKSQSSADVDMIVRRFEEGLSAICDQKVTLDVNLDTFLPRINAFGQGLNFSQLPDGIRVTIAWLADFMMRQDRMKWPSDLGSKRPGILLLDEIESHLHPLWQRRLLPSMKKALPDVQIIATSHSPFLISSCRGARIHILEMQHNGKAVLRESIDAPIGESVSAILSDIFGVDSQFDIETEAELNEWAELNKHRLYGELSANQATRLNALTANLASRSEELKALVGGAAAVAPSQKKRSKVLRAWGKP